MRRNYRGKKFTLLQDSYTADVAEIRTAVNPRLAPTIMGVAGLRGVCGKTLSANKR